MESNSRAPTLEVIRVRLARRLAQLTASAYLHPTWSVWQQSR